MQAKYDPDKHKHLLKSSLHYLKYRSRSKHEMTTYLQKKYPSADSGSIKAIINKLEDLNLIDDSEFTVNWINAKINQGKGPYIINRQLRHFGIEGNIITEALSHIPQSIMINSAKRLIQKKSRLFNKLNISQKKSKIYKYLYNRGYPTQIISNVIDDIMGEGVK